jgi:hypothetical protein
LYALACISYELLTGAHPFARRAATLVRNFGVTATRPADLTGRQWKTLEAGLSWHRAGRSMSVHTWIQRLTPDMGEAASTTPLHELKAASAARRPLQSRAAAAVFAVLLIAGACIAQLRETSTQKTIGGAATQAAPDSVKAAALEPTLRPEGPPPAALAADVSIAGAKDALDGTAQAKPSVRPPPFTISVDGYHVSSEDRFVEIRVHRNQLQKNSSFAWWTEPATARQDVDYVHQAKAILTFPAERRSTRLYVKLLPESGRSQRDYFYVAIAQPGGDRISDKVTRARIWLPTPRDHLQAQR